MKFMKKLRLKWKRSSAERTIFSIEHDLKFTTPFFCGTLYERKKAQLDKKLDMALHKLEIIDKECAKAGIK